MVDEHSIKFFNTYEARIVKKHGSPKRKLQLRFGLLGGFIRCLGNLVIIGWSIGIQLNTLHNYDQNLTNYRYHDLLW